VVLGVVGLALSLAAWRLMLSVKTYVHGLPAYQVAFRDIALDPTPPLWFRGGAPALLERVRLEAHAPEEISVLDADLKDLANAFGRDPWVRSVRRVERLSPGSRRLVVHLEYRKPVARASAPQRPDQIVDQEGILLPHDDIDFHRSGPLIRIWGELPPPALQSGDRWVGVSGAIRLATFLQDRTEHGESVLTQATILLNSEDHLFLQFPQWDAFVVFWDHPPGEEKPGEPTFAVKLSLILDWIKSHDPRGVQHPNFLRITPSGLVPAVTAQ
jgi:hypothetical protein